MLRNQRLSEIEKESIKSEYLNSNHTLAELGKKYNVASSTIHRVVKKHNVLRKKEWNRSKLTKENEDKVYNDFIYNNMAVNDLTYKYGVSHHKITNVLNRKIKQAKEVEINNRLNDDFGIPKLDGVDIYKTEGAWGEYQKEQYRILKWIKGGQR